MKALIISDKQNVIDLLNKRLTSEGFDTIIYKWLLKALDNIEEIRPDYIILSAKEYPRHWKTLASFVQSGIGGNDVRFCLYEDEILSSEDKEKAEQLGVEFYSELKDFVEEDEIIDEETPSIQDADTLNVEEVPTVEGVFTDNQECVEDINNDYSIIISEPVTGKLLFGKSIQLSFDTFECNLTNENFSINQQIKYITVSNDKNCLSFKGEIVSLTADKTSIKVLKYYEK